MASLPKGEGAEELIAQSCAALGACSRYQSSTNPPIIDTDTVYPSPPGTHVPFKRTSNVSNIKLTIPTFHLHPSRDTPKLSPGRRSRRDSRLCPRGPWTRKASPSPESSPPRTGNAALDFVNQLSIVAEEEGHHPDVHLTNWRDVEVVASTHAIGGLSLHDFVLAAKLDTIDVTYSPKWLRENAE
jgi:4a-hydroxytetrahydrobiopterin dehydratase